MRSRRVETEPISQIGSSRVQQTGDGEARMSSLAFGSSIVGAVALVFGLGLVAPVNGTVGGLCDLIAIVSAMVLVGLLDGV
jgi:hypothetical protein